MAREVDSVLKAACRSARARWPSAGVWRSEARGFTLSRCDPPREPTMNRLRRLGLQRRIMLYVTGGLAAMFGVLVFLGLGAIEEATQLVFKERLTRLWRMKSMKGVG